MIPGWRRVQWSVKRGGNVAASLTRVLQADVFDVSRQLVVPNSSYPIYRSSFPSQGTTYTFSTWFKANGSHTYEFRLWWDNAESMTVTGMTVE